MPVHALCGIDHWNERGVGSMASLLPRPHLPFLEVCLLVQQNVFYTIKTNPTFLATVLGARLVASRLWLGCDHSYEVYNKLYFSVQIWMGTAALENG